MGGCHGSQLVGMLGRVGGECVVKSPIWGMCVVRVRWSLWLGSVVVMVASFRWECAKGGRRRSRWSKGELLGMYVGMWGSPTWVSDVVLQSSSSRG
jgi:hypothetical protein